MVKSNHNYSATFFGVKDVNHKNIYAAVIVMLIIISIAWLVVSNKNGVLETGNSATNSHDLNTAESIARLKYSQLTLSPKAKLNMANTLSRASVTISDKQKTEMANRLNRAGDALRDTY
jgi:hypothetical protein